MLTIYDGGSDKDYQLDVFTGNSLPPTTVSSGNQMFISYTINGNGLGKGFFASFTFGKNVTNFNLYGFVIHVTIFALLKDNLCDNALDLKNGQLIVENNWAFGTYCQWLISAQDNDDFVTIEFQNFHVKITLAFKKIILLHE